MPDLTPVPSAAVLGCYLLACYPADDTSVLSRSDAGEPWGKEYSTIPPATDTDVQADAPFPANWCARAGSTASQQAQSMLDIGHDYLEFQKRDCRTSGLTAGMTRKQDLDWGNYLIAYTYVMTGCHYLTRVRG